MLGCLTLGVCAGMIILETAVGDAKATQLLEPYPLSIGAAFTFWECSAPIKNGSDSRSCVVLASPTAVSRTIHKICTAKKRISDQWMRVVSE